MEQEYGEPNSATSLAARTVLPGEPFDAPAASAVPAPRDVPPGPPEPAPENLGAPPQWNFGPPTQGDLVAAPPRSFDPASYDPTYGDPNTADPHHPPQAIFTPTYATAESLTEPDQFESLHQFGALPVTEGTAPAYPLAYDASAPPAYPAPEAATAYPAAAPAQTDMPPAFAGQAAWPAPMQEPVGAQHVFATAAPQQAPEAPPAPPTEEPPTGEDPEGAHRKSNRRPSPALLVLAAVVVLGGGGYYGYTQLSKSDSNGGTSPSTGPVTPAKPSNSTPVTPTGATYAFPSHLAGFGLRSGSSAAALKRQITSFSKTAYPAYLGTPQIASYGSVGSAAVVAITFHSAASKLAAGFTTMLAGVQKPATGNVVGAFTSVPTGAAGGSMTCGAQSGASPISYCVWKGTSTIGMVYMKGSTQTPNTQALTRELRAYAEH